MNPVKLMVLGAPGVGKTSIVQQYVWNYFADEYIPTKTKNVLYPSALINDHLYEMKLVDLPVIPYFPNTTFHEWNDYRFIGLRSASAYVLVFDLNSLDSFQYVKSLREQIFESRNMSAVPVYVVGNKHDLCQSRDRREVASLVKKHWKCGYMECSAKYNWHIVQLFRELLKAIDYLQYGQKPSSARLEGFHGALIGNRKKCVIL